MSPGDDRRDRRSLVIGVGNDARGDDGAGLAVAGAVRAALGAAGSGGPDADVRELDGEAARLIEAWDGRALVVVVDAATPSAAGGPAGTVHRVEVGDEPLPAWVGGRGTHDVGVADAIRLARVLDRLPDRLVLVTVAGASFAEGDGLSAEVAGALPAAVDAVLAELGPRPAEGRSPCASTSSAR